MTDDAPRVCLCAIAGAFGVKGDLRLKAFTENPTDIGAYGPLTSEDGARTFTLSNVRLQKGDMVAARAKEVTNREAALALKGVRLYVDRAVLPDPEEDEFYIEDLVGLTAVHVDGRPMGRVKAVLNHGAGDILELVDIPGVKGVMLVPFTKEAAPDIDIAKGEVTVDPPPMIEGSPPEEEEK